MKTRTKTLLAALMLLAISCKKEATTIQSSGINAENSTEDRLTAINETGGPAARTVRIGSQIWMTKNLSVVHYRNGDRIPQVKDPAKWEALTTGAWCWYNNDSANGCIYGRLYNWYAVNDPRGLAPAGWHIPSDAEWDTLTKRLGGRAAAGGKMKSTGTIEDGTGLWHAPNSGATNSSGFTGLPGGYRHYNGLFAGIGYEADWWSSTETSSIGIAWYRSISYSNGEINKGNFYEQNGFSVRCVKD